MWSEAELVRRSKRLRAVSGSGESASRGAIALRTPGGTRGVMRERFELACSGSRKRMPARAAACACGVAPEPCSLVGTASADQHSRNKKRHLRRTIIKLMSLRTNRALSISVLVALLATAACSKHEAVKRYAMTGKVISVDANKPEVVVDSKEIPGFMQAMVMSYPVKDASLLKGIAAGDEISSTVVVEEHNYWLENIEVTKKASGAPPKTSQFRIPQPG